ncbi:MAG: imidazole glycerol phosphate synthase subunit HisH [Planctomycetota bacterium]
MSVDVVHIVRTGTANIASVMAAVRRLDRMPVLTDEPGVVQHCDKLILPGVGAMGATVAELERQQLVGVLRARLAEDRPTLAVCMGHQLLGRESAESPGVPGLGAHDGCAVRFEPGEGRRVPQLGWSRIEAPVGARFFTESGHAYFANSYCFRTVPEGWLGATAEYDGSFVAALERGNVLTCQFHPELSGPFGLALVHRWLELAHNPSPVPENEWRSTRAVAEVEPATPAMERKA